MKEIPFDHIRLYRLRTFKTDPESRIRSKSGAIEYVNDRGFIFFWPIKDVVLPSLWVAVAGDRPVADAHDDPGHITWNWKDSLLGKKVWYYAKVLKKKATLIGLEIVPLFYVLSNNFDSPEEDYLTLYEQGRMTHIAKQIYEIILYSGPIDTVSLRRELNIGYSTGKSRFNRALVELQSDLKILPVEVTQSGGWRYSFAYDIVPRHLPDIISTAREISEEFARKTLLNLYFHSVGAAQRRDVLKLFGWRKMETEKTIQTLIYEGLIHPGYSVINQPGEWLIHEACLGT
jgi:hypothetical protein